MSENTKIEWADHTFNPWEGCQRVGPGCDHCYAENRNARFGSGVAINWGPDAPRRRTSMANWRKPLAWNAAHDAFFAQHGHHQRVFCASLADVFDNAVNPQWREDLFKLIQATPNLDWLLLTKRIGNVPAMVSMIPGWMPPNVWLGATVVNQAEADRDIPKLLAVPAAKRFLSMEPLLGAVDLGAVWVPNGILRNMVPCLQKLDWVIAGGESGQKARPMHPDWARSLRDQCEAAGVPFLFKQWGEWAPTWAEAHWHLVPFSPLDPAGPLSIAGTTFGEPPNRVLWPVVKVGKTTAGRLLDGKTHDDFPTSRVCF